MKKEPQKTLSIRLALEEYQALCRIAEAEGRYTSRQAAYWVKCALRDWPCQASKNCSIVEEDSASAGNHI